MRRIGMDSPSNRRGDERVSVQVPVHVSNIDPEVQSAGRRRLFRLSNGVCLNLSRSGAYIRIPGSLRPGTRVLMEIQLPGVPSVEAIGKIIWGRSSEASDSIANFGVKFFRGVKDQFSSLDNFISTRSAPDSDSVAI